LKEGLDFTRAESGVPDAKLQVPDANQDARLEVWIAPDGGDEYTDKTKRLGRISRAVASGDCANFEFRCRDYFEDKAAKVVPSDFAVLVSSHEQAEVICCALRECG
jgi:ATP-dependent exoDNAse (exonuclease V) beta subunit